MAKVGYIFIATNGEEYAEDKAWMQQYGCVQVIEELSEHERLRPMWKQLISSLERGDELVVSIPTEALLGRPGVICTPHLGASTPEAEDNCAVMAAQEISDYLKNGNITHSVNMPEA